MWLFLVVRVGFARLGLYGIQIIIIQLLLQAALVHGIGARLLFIVMVIVVVVMVVTLWVVMNVLVGTVSVDYHSEIAFPFPSFATMRGGEVSVAALFAMAMTVMVIVVAVPMALLPPFTLQTFKIMRSPALDIIDRHTACTSVLNVGHKEEFQLRLQLVLALGEPFVEYLQICLELINVARTITPRLPILLLEIEPTIIV